ncbi:hypothetical protein [Bradyrhizobium sp. McL0615]|uniref:hypothetical protein n=1 Tax=Bradyrhizobium sp. McL0615 TaxID=3415673 RepID=UPI003CE9C0EC
MTNPVLRAINNPLGDPALDLFLQWCDGKGIRPIPMAPADIAVFVRQAQTLGIEKVAATVAAISKAYLSRGLADPTAGGPVAAAMNEIAWVEPPRSWPKDKKPWFLQLPHELQVYLSERDDEQTRVIRRAQNEAADARKALAATKETNDGIQQNTAA